MIKQRPYVNQRARETKRLKNKVPFENRYYVIDFLNIREPIAWKYDFRDKTMALKRVLEHYPKEGNFFDIWTGKKLLNHLDTIKFYRVDIGRTGIHIWDYGDNPISKEEKTRIRSRKRNKIKREQSRKHKDQLKRKNSRARRRKDKQ
tara:strand:+ start:5213 stop:5653 length:441 start_codon:yes stop_codon:yes gene_type:complete